MDFRFAVAEEGALLLHTNQDLSRLFALSTRSPLRSSIAHRLHSIHPSPTPFPRLRSDRECALSIYTYLFVLYGIDAHHLSPRNRPAAGLVACGLQIMELESKVTQLQEEVDKGGGGAAKKQNGENIPRPPCKYTLSGHRNNINSVRYTPHMAHHTTPDTRHTRQGMLTLRRGQQIPPAVQHSGVGIRGRHDHAMGLRNGRVRSNAQGPHAGGSGHRLRPGGQIFGYGRPYLTLWLRYRR